MNDLYRSADTGRLFKVAHQRLSGMVHIVPWSARLDRVRENERTRIVFLRQWIQMKWPRASGGDLAAEVGD